MPRQRTKTPAGPTPVDSIKHKDTRKNIPTEELRDFVAAEEAAPPRVFYPRDPSLDPQLVWKGEDEQNQHPLEVPVVPIYIQEKVHPQAIVVELAIDGSPRQVPGSWHSALHLPYSLHRP